MSFWTYHAQSGISLALRISLRFACAAKVMQSNYLQGPQEDCFPDSPADRSGHVTSSSQWDVATMTHASSEIGTQLLGHFGVTTVPPM